MLVHLSGIRSWAENRLQSDLHRQLIFVDLPYKHASQCFSSLGLTKRNTLFFSQNHACETRLDTFKPTCISPKQYRHYLGNNATNVIYDASFGIDFNVLYGVSGQVLAPGFIIIWFNTDIVDEVAINAVPLSFGFEIKQDKSKNLLLENTGEHTAIINSTTYYLPDKINTQNNKFDANQNSQQSQFAQDNHPSAKMPLNIFSSRFDSSMRYGANWEALESVLGVHFNIRISEEQRNTVNTIISQFNRFQSDKHLIHKRNDVHCILGERGRGKSTTLAILLFEAALTNNKPNNIFVTSLHKQNLVQVRNIFNELKHFFDKEINHVPEFDELFAAPDFIVAAKHPVDMIFIDEVASLAPDLLKTLISNSKVSVISGTTSGYEGSGMGFTTRVLPFLKERNNICCYYLNRPYRWHEDDPIEQFFDSILCHKSAYQKDQVDHIDYQKLKFKHVDNNELLRNKSLYQAIISLLFKAHYQTNPNDIVRMLNAPESKLYIATYEHKIVAAMTIFVEGSSLLKPYCDAISLNTRRVQGHLSAQGLANAIIEPELACIRYWRVNRIAVRDTLRGINIGSFMLDNLCKEATSEKIDAVTSSFGFQTQLFNFWTKNNFKLVKLGRRIDTSSGSASVIMLKPITSALLPFNETLQNNVALELVYFDSHLPRLREVYQSLYNDPSYLSTTEQKTLIDFALKRCKKWIKDNIYNQIDFEKLAPFLFTIASYHSKFENNLQDEFASLIKGGMHKSDRNSIEDAIKNMVFEIIEPG